MNKYMRQKNYLKAFRVAILCGISLQCTQPAFAGWHKEIKDLDELDGPTLLTKCDERVKKVRSATLEQEQNWHAKGKTKAEIEKKWLDRAIRVGNVQSATSLSLEQKKEELLKGEKIKDTQDEVTDAYVQEFLKELGDVSKLEKSRLLNSYKHNKDNFQKSIEESPSSSSTSSFSSTGSVVNQEDITDDYLIKFFEAAGIKDPAEQERYSKQARNESMPPLTEVKQDEMTEEKLKAELDALGNTVSQRYKDEMLKTFRENKSNFQKLNSVEKDSTSSASSASRTSSDVKQGEMTEDTLKAQLDALGSAVSQHYKDEQLKKFRENKREFQKLNSVADEGTSSASTSSALPPTSIEEEMKNLEGLLKELKIEEDQREMRVYQARIVMLKNALAEGKTTYQNEGELLTYVPETTPPSSTGSAVTPPVPTQPGDRN